MFTDIRLEASRLFGSDQLIIGLTITYNYSFTAVLLGTEVGNIQQPRRLQQESLKFRS